MSYFYYQSKKIYYSESGHGEPVVFLHGDTASSRMFELLLPLYEEKFKVVLMDFLGNGRSDRVESLPVQLWCDQGKQVSALLKHLQYEKVSLVGTSGGAWAALNAALGTPELVDKVVADSFDGRSLPEGFADALIKERTEAEHDEMACGFYEWCQGNEWKTVVKQNTEALVKCAEQQCSLFVKPLTELKVPLMLMGTKEDKLVRENIEEEYDQIAEETSNVKIYMFDRGSHPAILSNAEEAAVIIRNYLLE